MLLTNSANLLFFFLKDKNTVKPSGCERTPRGAADKLSYSPPFCASQYFKVKKNYIKHYKYKYSLHLMTILYVYMYIYNMIPG